ncbi:MAG: hypothetical protein VXZ78_07135, partial [Pseudomonadota bacterium]|nr:hypothetical protein [Pseudomonadota bacterium]
RELTAGDAPKQPKTGAPPPPLRVEQAAGFAVSDGARPVDVAAGEGHAPLLEALGSWGLPRDTPNGQTGDRHLHAAARGGGAERGGRGRGEPREGRKVLLRLDDDGDNGGAARVVRGEGGVNGRGVGVRLQVDGRKLAERLALRVRAAVATGEYVRFFKLYHTAPGHASYVMDTFVDRLRLDSLKVSEG